MKYLTKALAIVFLLIGGSFISAGLTGRLACIGATTWSNFISFLPITIFGTYCIITALLLWIKPKIGKYFAIAAIAFVLIQLIFNFSLAIKSVGCSTLTAKDETTNKYPNKPFVQVREDADVVYYEGHARVSGTFWAGSQVCFSLNPDQESLFPGLKTGNDGKKSFCFEPYDNALELLNLAGKISSEPKVGVLCEVDGEATVYISSYVAAKSLEPGNYNQAKLETILSMMETGYRYFEQSGPTLSCGSLVKP